MSDVNRLKTFNDREIRDFVQVYKCIFGHTDLDIEHFVSFIHHKRTRTQNP